MLFVIQRKFSGLWKWSLSASGGSKKCDQKPTSYEKKKNSKSFNQEKLSGQIYLLFVNHLDSFYGYSVGMNIACPKTRGFVLFLLPTWSD